MSKLYFLLFFGLVLLFVYWAGVRQGNTKCHENVAQSAMQIQTNLFKVQEKINEEVITGATDDIRRILHQKYTIAD